MRFTLMNVLFMLTFFSCGEKSSTEVTSGSPFSLEGYFAGECTRLENGGFELEKSLESSGTTETKLINDPEWKSELDPFLKASVIKNTAMLYRTDTSSHSGVRQITYNAIDSVTPLRSIIIYGETHNPDSILFIRKVSNMYYQSSDSLFYSKGSYRIHVQSSTHVGKDSEFRLTGKVKQPTANL